MFGRAKVSDKDFTLEGLPKTRKEQFFDIFKHNFFFVLTLGLLLIVFAAPFLIAFTYKYVGVLASAYESLSEAEYYAFYNTNQLVFDGVYAICFIIFALGVSGVLRVIRKLVWGEGIFLMSDFFKGIKQNWLAPVIVALIISLLRFITDLVMPQNVNIIVKYIAFAFEMVLFPLFLMVLSISTIYSKNLVTTFGNAFVMILKRPLRSLLFILFPLAISFIKYIPSSVMIVQVILYIVVIVIFTPFYLLAWYLFSLDSFDEFTNLTYYPEYYHRGLMDQFLKNRDELIKEKQSLRKQLTEKNDEKK